MTLTEFLTARLDEDEAAVRANAEPGVTFDQIRESPESPDFGIPWWGLGDERQMERLVISSARVLAEVAAKRRIVELERQRTEREYEYIPDQDEILRSLASVYADHPDYNPAWA